MYERGFGLIIIKEISKLANLYIANDTNSGFINPIGFNSDLKGPKIIFFIFNFFCTFLSFRLFLNEIN